MNLVIQMRRVFHNKYLIGVVGSGIESISSQRSLKVNENLLNLGKAGPEQSLVDLESSLKGLSSEEARKRLERFGPNEVSHEKPPAWWVQLLSAFWNPFIFILIVLGVVSFFTDVWLVSPEEKDFTKIIILFAMVSISGVLRFWQEFRSQRMVDRLKGLVQNRAFVIREDWEDDFNDARAHGNPVFNVENGREIPITQIVPGDIVRVSAGDMIPADMRLLSSQDLFLSQSALTGESMPIEKFAVPETIEEKEENEKDRLAQNPLDLNTLCFMGTNVVSGSGTGIVLSTGSNTYFGSIAKKITGQRAMTSFDKGVNKVSWLLIRFMLVMVPVVFVLNGATKGDWTEALFFALAVAVGLTPEMLPLVVTANLSKGAIAMAKKEVIIKKLNAIQNFGAIDVLCTDKTGTITENRVVLVRHLDAEGEESKRTLDLAYLNSFFQTGLKNLMDQAIIERKTEDYPDEEQSYHKIDEVPFDFSRRRMSVIVQKDKEEHLLVCKGAIEEVLSICTKVEHEGEIFKIADFEKKQADDLSRQLNQDGLRVLAVAYKKVSDIKEIYSVEDEGDLVLAGYIGFLDPPKESAAQALKSLKEEGVAVKIVTGDNEVVTTKICKEVGLDSGSVLLGHEIELLNDDELIERVEETTIFAKVDPLQKARIVTALKRAGHTVGFMGDGVNDAAAMYESDVGISVDAGVDIAKEAADIILLKNDLNVLQKGIIEGRTIFGNIIKYIKMTTSSNFGNAFSVLGASIFLPFLPMLPLHLLVQNLLYDISQLSIPLDSMSPEFLKKPRKWEASDISRFMIFIGPISSIFDLTTFLMMWYVFKANTPAMQSLFHSGWFVEGLLSQTLIVHMIRTEKIPFIQSRATKPVLFLTGAIMTIGLAIPFTGFGRNIGLQALPLTYFPLLLITLVGYSVLTQIVKSWYIKRFKSWL